MNIKPEANCPCGSGRTYRKCCGIYVGPQSLEQRTKNRALIGEALDSVLSKGLSLMERYEGSDVEEAWDFFTMGVGPRALQQQERLNRLFACWAIFDWPSFEHPDAREDQLATPTMTIAEYFLHMANEHPKHMPLTQAERAVLMFGGRSAHSWYKAAKAPAGATFELEDLFTGQDIRIGEDELPDSIADGDLVLARVCSLYGVTTVFALFPTTIAAEHEESLRGRCARVPALGEGPTAVEMDEIVGEGASELIEQLSPKVCRDVCLRILFTDLADEQFPEFTVKSGEASASEREQIEQAIASGKVTLLTTDGDPVEHFSITMKLTASEPTVRERLLPLVKECIGFTEDEFLNAPEATEPAKALHFDWQQEASDSAPSEAPAGDAMFQQVLIAHFELQSDTLAARVRSANRRDRVLQRVSDLLGDALGEVTCMAEQGATGGWQPKSSDEQEYSVQVSAEGKEEMSEEELLNLPEVKARLSELSVKYWDDWLTTALPMLGGRSPEEAAKTTEGRAQLEELFTEYKRMDEESGGSSPFRPDIGALRRKLGIG